MKRIFCKVVQKACVVGSRNYSIASSRSAFRELLACQPVLEQQRRTEATIIDGTKMAKQIRREVKQEVDRRLELSKRAPHLTVVIVGEDPASKTYVRNKTKACDEVGFTHETIIKPADIDQTTLLQLIQDLNVSPDVDGILVQLPVPQHISERAVCNAVTPEKDVDGFHCINVGRFCQNMHALVPATPAGVLEMIRRSGVETFGKNAVVCGRSKNVGMPIAMLLHSDKDAGELDAGDATTTICHRYTPREQLRVFTLTADIIVTATGLVNLITADMIKEGATIIDVGINRIKDPKTGKSKMVGDVDFEGVKEKAGFITPVPGGVGPMTVAMLMKNTLMAAEGRIDYSMHRQT